MSLQYDPEGIESTLHPTTALSLIVPAQREVFLYASFDGAWEQAVVLYLDGQRFESQLGSFILRPSSLTVPAQSLPYELMLVGWHKRSSPNAALPWVASRGQRIGPVLFAWDDSADDNDFRDTRIKLVTG
ncbi:MAG TPA: hypothetical protein VL981_07445 [Candidatus Methylacidiphilales bacterium]|nr:hypothetical protein [Candidatus Methylacidiphilales bacterium]